MIIRCERCSTLYELDETLLAPEGSPVQCTRCQAVFSARPPRPAPEAAAPAAPPVPAPAQPAPAAAPVAGPAAAAAPVQAAAPAPPVQRPVRPGPAVYRPPSAAGQSSAATQPATGRGAPARRGTVNAVEARAQRATIGRKLIVPAAVMVLVAILAGGALLWRRRPDPEILRVVAEASARLTQDDAGSLARAIQLYDGVLARSPARREAVAERALARVLQGAAQLEEAEPMADLLAARRAERERLMAQQSALSQPAPAAPPPAQGGAAPQASKQPSPSDDAIRLLAVEVTRLEGELAPRRKAAEALLAQAAAEVKPVAASPAGARTLAVLAAVNGDREELGRQAPLARAGGADAWVDLAEAWLELKAPEGREAALGALGRLVGAHPELVRARWLLARAQAAAGRREEATATVTGLLAANPRHERAQRLKTQLALAPVQPLDPPAPAPAQPPPQAWQRPAAPPAQVVPRPAAAPPAPASAEAHPPGAAPGAAGGPAPAPAPAEPAPQAAPPVEPVPAPAPPLPPAPKPRPPPAEEPADSRYEPG